jgi:hypothetical protein
MLTHLRFFVHCKKILTENCKYNSEIAAKYFIITNPSGEIITHDRSKMAR